LNIQLPKMLMMLKRAIINKLMSFKTRLDHFESN